MQGLKEDITLCRSAMDTSLEGFYFNTKLMIFLGVYSTAKAPTWKLVLFRLHKAFMLANRVIQIYLHCNYLYYVAYDIKTTDYNMTTNICTIMTCVKMIVMVWKEEELAELEESFKNLMSIPQVTESLPNRMFMKRRGDMMAKISKVAHYGTQFYLAVWLLTPLFQGKGDWTFPIAIHMPFAVNYSPLYEISYVYMYLQSVTIALYVWGIDIHMYSLVMQLTSHLEILSTNLEALNKETDIARCKESFKGCIKHHIEILRHITKLNNVLSYHLLPHFVMSSAVLLVLAMYHLLVPFALDTVYLSMMSFSSSTVANIFIACEFLDMLNTKFQEVGESAYNIQWHDKDPSFKKAVSLMMVVSQSPINVTAGKFFRVTRATFQTIMSNVYNGIAVAQQMLN